MDEVERVREVLEDDWYEAVGTLGQAGEDLLTATWREALAVIEAAERAAWVAEHEDARPRSKGIMPTAEVAPLVKSFATWREAVRTHLDGGGE